MPGHMMVIPIEGDFVSTTHDTVPSLTELKAAIGGEYLEHVPYFDTIFHEGRSHACVAFCNEEGKIHGLRPNSQANAWWYTIAPQVMGHDHLVGPVVVLWGDDAFMQAI